MLEFSHESFSNLITNCVEEINLSKLPVACDKIYVSRRHLSSFSRHSRLLATATIAKRRLTVEPKFEVVRENIKAEDRCGMYKSDCPKKNRGDCNVTFRARGYAAPAHRWLRRWHPASISTYIPTLHLPTSTLPLDNRIGL